MSGWTVPGYTEIKSLGAGGFGAVVLARHDATGTPVAIKYLRAELLSDPDFLTMFRAEADLLGELDDPHVVRLYEYIEAPAGAAIVMELVDGVTVRDILSRLGKTSPEAALVVLYGSLLGLAGAHYRGVVHRDYKPANVLVNAYGASKLTDFGIAARSGTAPVPAGSLAYAPPEQFKGEPATPAADVYAATATYYECLTGHPPFSGGSAETLLRQHQSGPVPLDPGPGPLRPVIAAGLAKDPRQRPESAAALAAALRSAAVTAHGYNWEERGRQHLAEAALLLVALWPAGGAPPGNGFTVEQVSRARGYEHGHAAVKAASGQPAHVPEPSDAALHHWHVLHVLHLDHLTHLRYLGREGGAGPQTARNARRTGSSPRSALSALSTATAAAAAVAVAAAVITVAATSGRASPPGVPGAALGRSLASSAPGTPRPGTPSPPGRTPVAPRPGIPLTAASGTAPVSGDVYVSYHGSNSSARLSGTLPGAVPGELVRLYAAQFPFTASPVLAASRSVGAGGGYSFKVTPTLATRYEVKLFKSATAASPVAVSASTTIYVVASGTVTNKPAATGACGRPVCHVAADYTFSVPPVTMGTELSKPWLGYFGLNLASSGVEPALPAALRLGAGDPAFTRPVRVAPDEFTLTVSFAFTVGNDAYHFYWEICSKDTEAQDGLGLPGAHNCGAASIPVPPGYLG